MEKMRLDRLLCSAGAGTRSEVKQMIRRGRVTVDGLVCREAERRVDSEAQRICLDGRAVLYTAFEYYMLNKASGCVSAVLDRLYPTVLHGIDSPRKKELFPVGRLDLDSEGLLLITNDGELAHRLLSPKRHVEKTYYVRVRGLVTEEDVRLFAGGLDIGEEKKTMPARLVIRRAAPESEAEVTICEGKYHQVKRMFQAVGKEVLYLKRLSMGSLRLDGALERGAYRPLNETEIRRLREDAAYE